MGDFEKLGSFYLGKRKDTGDLLLYDSKDLVTHAVCVGMTGSGKTGLCLSLLEEAAIDGIPAIVIDPKGDIGNLLLTFPELRPEDFEPWVNADDARSKGLDVKEFAEQTAEKWKNGLAAWGQNGERIRKMRDAVDITLYTPGSDTGIPVSVLSSFAAPPEAERQDKESFRDRVAGSATSLLALAGIDADPLQSREHVLLSTIFDAAWRDGKDLDVPAIIAQVQTPPFSKVGVLDLDSFYPAKERFGLAMALNNLLASPGFETWMQGEPLDIQRMLFTPQGKPRVSIFCLSHMSDSERMFFVTLLLNQLLGWARAQGGTTSLRSIFYMDEIFGYFPPVANPPSKKPLLTLLKQARAYGLGIVLATQNPVDLDYKGLANAGTWLIGRLQTERDKERVLEGLEGAASSAGAKFDRGRMTEILAGLGNRIFLMNNVHDDEPSMFETRWALSYLRGPLARPEIERLMADRKRPAAKPAASPAVPAGATGGAAKPVLPPEVAQYFVPLRSPDPEPVYQPRALAAAQVHFADPKLGIDEVRDILCAAPITDGAVAVDWAQAEVLDVPAADLEKEAAEGAKFAEAPSPAAKSKNYAAWGKSFATWIYQTQSVDLYRCAALKETSKPGESEGDFRARLGQKTRESRDSAAEKLRQKYAPKQRTLEDRLLRAQQKVEAEKQQAQSQTIDSVVSIGSSILGAFLGKKTLSATNVGRLGTATRSASRIGKERADVGRAEESVEAIQQQIQDLDAEFQQEVAALSQQDAAAIEVETLCVKPKKANINVQFVSLGWLAE